MSNEAANDATWRIDAGRRSSAAAILLLVASLTACVSSHVLVGTARPAISPDQVRLYLHPPTAYEEVALLHSSSRVAWTPSAQAKTDKVVERLKKEAAALGANGVLLQGVGEQNDGSIGLASTQIYDASHGAFTLASGFNVVQQTGTGIAIYVAPDQAAAR